MLASTVIGRTNPARGGISRNINNKWRRRELRADHSRGGNERWGDHSEILPVGSVNKYSHSALKLARSSIITKSYSQLSDVIITISRHILKLSRARCYDFING